MLSRVMTEKGDAFEAFLGDYDTRINMEKS